MENKKTDKEKERLEYGMRERDQLNLSRIIWEEERKNFTYLDLQCFVAQTKNDDDLGVLTEKLTEWHNSIKIDDPRRKTYLDLLLCAYRIHSYCFNLQTISQHATAKWNTSEKLMKNSLSCEHKEKLVLLTRIKKLELELESAKKEIEYINKP